MSARRKRPFNPRLFVVGNNPPLVETVPAVKTVPVERLLRELALTTSTAALLRMFGSLTTSSNPREGNVHDINSRRNRFNAT